MRFPVVKLLDSEARRGEREASPNPFVLVVLALLDSRTARRGGPEMHLEAIATGLKLRFGPPGLELLSALGRVNDADVLRQFHEAVLTADTLDRLRGMIPGKRWSTVHRTDKPRKRRRRAGEEGIEARDTAVKGPRGIRSFRRSR